MTAQRPHPILRRIAWAHAVLVLLFAIGFALAGLPIKGTLVGGGFIGFSFVASWVFVRAIVEPQRRGLATAIGVLKFFFYALLGAAVLSGRFTVDAAGFAVGVTVFVIVAVTVALATPIVQKAES